MRFPAEHLPAIYDALEIVDEANNRTIIVEVAQHLGNDQIRAISMAATDGLRRGLAVRATGAPIQVPVGSNTQGRLFNVLGETIDNMGPVEVKEKWPIHRDPPPFEEQGVVAEILKLVLR